MSALERPAIVITAVVYAALVLAVGLWSARRTRDARDFFIAGQGIGLLVTGLAATSASFSGFVFVGGPGLTYRLGLASLFIVLPVGLTSGLVCWTLAKRLRLLAEVREVLSVPDALLHRFRSRTTSGLAAVAVVVGSVGYLGAQLLAMAVLVDGLFGLGERFGAWGLPLAMAAGLAVVLFYSAAGGMVAGVYTDLFQGLWMTAAAVAVFFYALDAGGGLGAMARQIAASEAFGPSFLDPLGRVPVATAMGFFFVFSVGVLGQPHVVHKFLMIDDPRKLRWMPLVIGLSQGLCLLIWLGIGLAVPALVAGGRLAPLENADQAAPAFLLGFVPEALAGVVFAGILAAIMSSADSFVNVAAAALVHDLPRAFGRKLGRELLWGRLAVLAVALAAAALALGYGDLVALLGTFAFGTFAAALAPALAVGLNWKRVTARAASLSIATGLVLNLGLELLARRGALAALPQPGVLPSALALAASLCVLFAVTWLTAKDDEPLDDAVAAVMEI